MGQDIEFETPDGRTVKMSVYRLLSIIGNVCGHGAMSVPLKDNRVVRLRVDDLEPLEGRL